jgi:hypothetical protein
MDTYAVTNESGGVVYGGIIGYEVTRDVLRIRLTEEAARGLSVPSEVTLALDVDAAALERLRLGLNEIVGNAR